MDDMFDQEKLKLRAGELVNQVWKEATGRASPEEQVRLRGVAYDLAARIYTSGRLMARPPLDEIEHIISEGLRRRDDASTIARAVLDLVDGPGWKGPPPPPSRGQRMRSAEVDIDHHC